MNTRQKTMVQETSRWLRVATLALTVLGPVVDTLVSRMRDRTPAPREISVDNPVLTHSQERSAQGIQLAAVGDALSQVMQDLKEFPYSQELLTRAEDLTEDLQERISHLSHDLVERGGQVTRDIGRRGSQATYELAAHGSKASRKLAKQGEQFTRDLASRSWQASQNEEHDDSFWTLVGFAVGLLAAGGAAYIFIRRRIQQNNETEQFELAQSERLSRQSRPAQTTGETHSSNQNAARFQPSVTPALAVADPEASRLSAIPADARIVGIIATHRYYPVQTALDLLAQGKLTADLEIIYFPSEATAESAGFSAAT
ncbi:MAG TPA: hypothetical protein VKR06_20495 [Ktedonosporobacter sp.]|nr:hypothetical protein [Ktedonosporobacter sp.]